ncbi:MAG: hypothetical protein PVG30_00655 [Gammaproteobacteria bacterium]|jgi:hypothetical protein
MNQIVCERDVLFKSFWNKPLVKFIRWLVYIPIGFTLLLAIEECSILFVLWVTKGSCVYAAICILIFIPISWLLSIIQNIKVTNHKVRPFDFLLFFPALLILLYSSTIALINKKISPNAQLGSIIFAILFLINEMTSIVLIFHGTHSSSSIAAMEVIIKIIFMVAFIAAIVNIYNQKY